MISLKLLLLIFQAPCSGYQPALKALLLKRFLRHDKILVAEAHLILGEWKIVAILRVFMYGLFMWAIDTSPTYPNFLLLHAILSTVLDIIGLYYPLLNYFGDYPINRRPSLELLFFCLF